MPKLAINGFGRIGRNVLRALLESGRSDVEITAINDLAPADLAAFLLEYDSIHGRLGMPVSFENDTLSVGGHTIKYFSERDPAQIPWSSADVDIVLECTGRFTEKSAAMAHIGGSVRRVLVSAPAKNADKTIVYGVNSNSITEDDIILSNASCTTNCLSPVAHVLQELCGISQGFMTTIHSYTGDQRLLDAEHSDKYRARAAAQNIIPTTTGAARAVGLVLPELAGKLDGVAVRVPTPNVSAVDLVFMPTNKTSVEAVNEAMIAAANGPLAGVLATTDKPLVSSDLNHHPASSILHLDQTSIMPDGMGRIFSWYDNEWGFSNRMLDVAVLL
jgi:glyceraldehyde 3-phosphate dehydrogenase